MSLLRGAVLSCAVFLCVCLLQAKVETVVRISASGKRDKEEHTGSEGSSSSSDSSNPSSSGTSTVGAGTTSGSPAAGNASSNATSGSSHGHDKDKEAPSTERGVDRIIDSQDNEFVLSAPPKDQLAALTLDPLLIQDLTFLLASAAVSELQQWCCCTRTWLCHTVLSIQPPRGTCKAVGAAQQTC